MNVHGYEIVKDWTVSNIGMTAQGKKGGKLYFMKRYGEYKLPRRDSSTSPRLYDKLKAEFDAFVNNRIAINTTLASLAGPGGNIVLPSDWFVDDIYYIEATEFVSSVIEDEEIFKLSRDNILFIMLTAAGALHNIHRKNIVHSDLKRTNILAARNSSGNTVAKIIDFDRAYFANDIRPDELGGDQSFMSPELAQCFMYDMADEALAYMSTKSDIFSLGLVFHNYLTGGEFPKIVGLTGALEERRREGKMVYSCEALLAGAGLEISRKVGDEYLTHLLAAMLQTEPSDRPTAQEVLEVLKTRRVLELKADSSIKIETESSPSKSKKTMPDTSFSKTKSGTDTETPTVPKGYCEPWAEHKFVFDNEKLAADGYVASEQVVHKDVKCYKLYKSDKVGRLFTASTLTILGLVKPADSFTKGTTAKATDEKPTKADTSTSEKGSSGGDWELWDEDSSYRFVPDALLSAGYKGAVKHTKNGTKGYLLIKHNDEQRFMTASMLKILKFMIEK